MDTLAITAGVGVVSAALYLYIGRVVGRRAVSADARLARNAFAAWWMLLGGLGLLGALETALYRSGHLPIWLYQTFTQVALIVLCAALCALQMYLVYLYTGSRRSFYALGAFYALLYLGFIALIAWVGSPQRITDNGWMLRTEPELQLSGGAARWFGVAFIAILLGPQIVAAIAYARLYRKTQDRTQRFRIALLTGAILVWFGTSAIVGAASNPHAVNVPWQIVQRILSVAAPLAILLAYKPPRWVRERYGVRSVDQEGQGAPA